MLYLHGTITRGATLLAQQLCRLNFNAVLRQNGRSGLSPSNIA